MAEAGEPYELQPVPPPRGETNMTDQAGVSDYGAGPSADSHAPPTIAGPAPPRPSSTASRRGRPEGKPPRPMNAWLIFRTAQLKLLKEENPEGPRKSQGEMSKIIAERWRNVDIETRQEYETMAKERKEEFRQAYPDYRYGPHKPKDKNAKARAGLPDPPTTKRSHSKPVLRLSGNGTDTHSDSRGSTDFSTMTRTVRVVSAPKPPNFRSSSPRAAARLPTPVSAHMPWSREQHLHLSPPSAHHVVNAASRGVDGPPPFSSALPASAPAASSSFQSSLASLGASINSLARAAPHQQLSEEDRYHRRVSISDYRQFCDLDSQYRDEHRRSAAVLSHQPPRGVHAETELPYNAEYPTPRNSLDCVIPSGTSAEVLPPESPRTSYYAMSANPPRPPLDYAGEHPSEFRSPPSTSLTSSAYAREPDAYAQLRHVQDEGQYMYDRPESRPLAQLQPQPPMLPDLYRYDGRSEYRPNSQSYETENGPHRW